MSLGNIKNRTEPITHISQSEKQRLINRSKLRLGIPDIELFQKLVGEYKPEEIVEVGSADGTSSVIFANGLMQLGRGRLSCVEPTPTNMFYDNINRYGLWDYVRLIKCSSPWVPVEFIPKIDLLFIDGDHRTRWVLSDYHYFEPFVKIGGLVVFHDWNGRYGYWRWVRRALEIVLEDGNLEEIDRVDCEYYGSIAFKKVGECPKYQQYPAKELQTGSPEFVK